ncbi:MAG: glycosyltransferase family 4 protein [Deltaproteobacteria bacterium]|nr:glycosyltransferase family 4 protein [Deltaproteobacteria bacterium]
MARSVVIHQFHATASLADAITQHMLFIDKCLRSIKGVQSRIFAGQIKGDLPSIHPLSDPSWGRCDRLLLHHSSGNPYLEKVLEVRARKFLVYHNITPESFFPHDARLGALSVQGRQQLRELRNQVVRSFADSKYNLRELKALGFPDLGLLPLLDIKDFNKKRYKVTGSGRTLLFVGRIAPHKGQELLIRVLHYLVKTIDNRFSLLLVGAQDPIYVRYLKLLSQVLGVKQSVDIQTGLSKKELDSAYRSSTAFLCVSHHEGFCIPLVEAMVNQLPIFYLPNASIPDTMGQAGVQLNTRKPHEIAEVVATTLEDSNAVESIIRGQSRQLGTLARFQNRETVRRILNETLQRV